MISAWLLVLAFALGVVVGGLLSLIPDGLFPEPPYPYYQLQQPPRLANTYIEELMATGLQEYRESEPDSSRAAQSESR